ncbi:MAG: hypothetical protein IJV29_02150 [Butyrivibrio sp.]|nr:hypothetical protein [Butyrivibrio sp.]
MALNIETKRINAMQALTGIADNDSIIVELAGGGTKRMTYATLLQILTDAIVGGGSQVLTADDIVQVMTNDEEVIPSGKLLYDMNELVQVAIREQRCINEGIDGVEWGLDDLMTLVRNGEFNKFAIGDSFVDGSIHWRIHGKKTFLKWAFDGSVGETPNTITCLPDEALGQHRYNSSNTNTGGYAASEMPSYLESTILPQLSAGLRSYIKETQIYENNKGAWAVVKRKMRIPTIIECTGNQGWADQYSGGICSQLPLMRAARHRIKSYWYWCLDPVASNTTHFCHIGSGGHSGYLNASNSDGSVRPEIVLG